MDRDLENKRSQKVHPREVILTNLRELQWISGQILGQIAGISRTAVWKHIKSLQKEGYPIQSSPKRGYMLQTMPDSLLPHKIKTGLTTKTFGHILEYYPKIDSTQKPAKSQALQGVPEGYTVLAENQYGGRGRRGRKWESGCGNLAMSIVLRPPLPPSDACHIPLLAGVATVQAIQKTTGLKPRLKWPNDIMMDNKKMGGILIELSAEMDHINYLILGLGLNVNNSLDNLSPDLQTLTTSLRFESGRIIDRHSLIQEILETLEHLYTFYLEHGFSQVKTLWKECNNTLDQAIVVYRGDTALQGMAEDITDHGALIFRDTLGQLHTVTAGDVSLRFKNPGNQ
jgi:BirA family biotin operon repressor/biotin-[acetyl-CoA-carboxylase] ligase